MTKPTGPIPDGFASDRDYMLLIGGRRADDLAAEAGDTPLFVYDMALVDRRVARFRAAFPGVDLHYAMKANPHPGVLRHMLAQVDGIDLASGGEMRTAIAAGGDPRRMSFAGPGKRDSELEAAIAAGVTINLESEGEAGRALLIAERRGVMPRLAVRVNPDFELKGSGMRMGGGAKPFGLDASRVPALVRRLVEAGAEWRGFHIFAGSQALSPDALIEAQRASVALAADLAEKAGAEPPLVNLGGGFGIPYVHGDQPLDIAPIGEELTQNIGNRPQALARSQFAIELGRWLVGECGVYLTRVLDRKYSQGKTFLVVDGGMHHQLAASGNFGQVIRRNYPVAIATRFGTPAEEQVSIVGCLCTPLDILADDVMMPCADVGDLVAVFLAGAYGLTASPQAFLSQHPAGEVVVNPAV
ncbi:pyridoxal-dependent decarboxylase, exosortase A system-associated [Sphingosinicella sp. YJ22]|uniref:pyridoxal-dependent decarboxylase, exosortase A system-associated n=1 Tax=Sphingosinicella sp. YJ22 TaxID=1104780 RepID=UPI00140D6570|nr:pyridoxal-dependent decarboxylase, exosortase A system-associated [Sphingosinicella sp. YJ22]